MSSIKKKKKKVVNTPKVSLYESIPDDVKMAFGKFYAYSLLYILFFGILYPWIIMYYLNKIFTVILFIVLVVLYGYIIYDIRKKTDKYTSNLFYFLIVLVFISVSISIVRLVI